MVPSSDSCVLDECLLVRWKTDPTRSHCQGAADLCRFTEKTAASEALSSRHGPSVTS